ncbi:MAG: hypothetical protein JNM40_17370 [Myxococcales bacterium]|nr:hypothetical protein [Myxococcales bacterium]
MENRVGSKTPSATELAKLTQSADDLLAALRKFCIVLSPDDRLTLTRMRLGTEVHLVALAAAAKKLGLALPGVSADDLSDDLRTDKDLAPLEQALTAALELVRDTRAQARSEAAEAGYMYYGMIQAAAGRLPELQTLVHNLSEVLSSRPRRKPPAP